MLPSYEVAGLPASGRTVLMGVLNVTPDSFSDGGNYLDGAAAIARGFALATQGADLVDVGGESTRPGAERVDQDTELDRVVPVVRALAEGGVAVSIDTMRAVVAEAALDAGAVMVNDVSGGTADPSMTKVVAAAEVPYVIVHSRGPSVDMQTRAEYADVVSEVCAELSARAEAAVEAGIERSRIVLDPGLGFAKRAEHNWALLAGLSAVDALGFPQLVGASRKGFLGRLLADPDGTPRPVTQRDDATTALTAYLAVTGVWGVRVHAVGASADAIAVVSELTRAQRTPS
ncbi:MAG: dihydropteroate synthase [Actinomycetes bacterium]